MNCRLRLLTIVFGIIATTNIQAQNLIKGLVVGDGNEPLIGASVRIDGKEGLGVATNSEGRFSIDVKSPGTYTIKAAYIGYEDQSKSITVPTKDEIVFHLQENAINLDAVVVTGTRTPKALKDAPIVTRLIGTNDIRRADATNIGDLLQSELPGIEFSYSMNQQTSLNMQGFGGNSVLFLIDGERLAGETLDNIDYNRLNLDNVERVEIVKGAASSLYGSNAVGGVVNIISSTPKKPWHVNVNGRWGAYGNQRYGGSVSFNHKRIASTTNVQYQTVNSIPLNTSVSTGGDYSEVYGHHSWNFKERLIINAADNLSFTGRAGYYYRERDYQPSTKDRYRDFTAGLRGNYTLPTGATLEATYAYDQYDKSDYQTLTHYDIRDYSNVQHTATARYTQEFLKCLTMTVGGDFLRDYLMSYQFENNGSHTQYTWDAYAQGDWNVTDKINLLGGLRFDSYSEAKVSRLTSKLSFMWKLRPFTLRASYSGGFRAPTLKEMYMNFDMASIFMIYGNPDLKSETSHNFSLTGEYTKGRYNFTLSGFFNAVDNRITTAWNTALGGQQYVNMSPLKIAGLEANAYAKWPCGIGARVSYAFTHEHIKKGEPQTSSTRPHTATVRLDYARDFKNYGFDVALNGRILSAVTVDEFTSMTSYEETERVRYPGYMMWKLNINQHVWRGIDVNFIVDNLLNYRPKYYYSSSPATRGINIAVSLSLNIDEFVK